MHAPECEADGSSSDVVESDIVPAFVDTASADTPPTGLIAEGVRGHRVLGNKERLLNSSYLFIDNEL